MGIDNDKGNAISLVHEDTARLSSGFSKQAARESMPKISMDRLLWHGLSKLTRLIQSKLLSTVEYGHIEVVKVLLRAGANTGTERKSGRTPAMIAKVFSRDDMVKELEAYRP
ncbi:unnamed protein product [Fusarium venenatum]|uniref:Uncharacterized protein n=1 Tax=Fusarium venenatum TaxID=56646 RepID=A0A2L2TJ74_9HYPO|nr:LOW QUALITY PROTEIN: uncharacterized protein FVRRES_13078 [Fusarium venenatum]CEI40387.1 unnamed protein product [Fusarium venenatum]